MAHGTLLRIKSSDGGLRVLLLAGGKGYISTIISMILRWKRYIRHDILLLMKHGYMRDKIKGW